MLPSLAERVFRTSSRALLPPIRAIEYLRGRSDSSAERMGKGGWLSVTPPDVWFHAASVGEVGGMLPVVRALRAAHPSEQLLLTTTSTTGREAGKKSTLFQSCTLFPYDHPGVMRSVLERAWPGAVVIAETEIWPNFLFELGRRKIPVVVVNGRISDYSFPNYRRLKSLLLPALLNIERFLVQSSVDAERYAALGVPEKRIVICGSTKNDFEPLLEDAAERMAYALELGLDLSRPIFVAGSVRPGEDQSVLDAYRSALKAHPGLQLVLAPRHPEQFAAAKTLLDSAGVSWVARSSGAADMPYPVLLLDSIGELRKVYALATIAFVGATLVDVGGHNPLEPAPSRVPVIVGPHTNNVRDAIAELARRGAHLEVSSTDELSALIEALLNDPANLARLGAATHDAWATHRGATVRVMSELVPILERRAHA